MIITQKKFLFVIGAVVLFVVLVIMVFRSQNNKSVEAESSNKIITSQADWEEGSYDSAITINPGDLELNPDSPYLETMENMPTARAQLRAESYNDKLYAIGGKTSGSIRTGEVEEYSYVTNSWVTRTAMPTEEVCGYSLKYRWGFTTASVEGNIYLFGGYDYICGYHNMLVYNIADDSWSAIADADQTHNANMASLALNGIIYTTGGTEINDTESQAVNAYDPATNTWSNKSSMNYHRTAHGLATVGGKLYAIGGSNDDGHPIEYMSSVEEYDPATNAWIEKTPMSTARSGLRAVAINDKIYAIGGFNGGYLNTIEQYSPDTDTWVNMPNMTVSRQLSGVSVINSKAIIVGGNNASYLDSNESFTPSTASATHTTAATQIDGQEGSTDKNVIEWTSFTPVQITPANTTIKYAFRTSDNGIDGWTGWSADQEYSGTSLDLTGLTANRYLRVRVTLSTTDGVSTPKIDDYTIDFHNNQAPEAPIAQTAVIGD